MQKQRTRINVLGHASILEARIAHDADEHPVTLLEEMQVAINTNAVGRAASAEMQLAIVEKFLTDLGVGPIDGEKKPVELKARLQTLTENYLGERNDATSYRLESERLKDNIAAWRRKDEKTTACIAHLRSLLGIPDGLEFTEIVKRAGREVSLLRERAPVPAPVITWHPRDKYPEETCLVLTRNVHGGWNIAFFTMDKFFMVNRNEEASAFTHWTPLETLKNFAFSFPIQQVRDLPVPEPEPALLDPRDPYAGTRGPIVPIPSVGDSENEELAEVMTEVKRQFVEGTRQLTGKAAEGEATQ